MDYVSAAPSPIVMVAIAIDAAGIRIECGSTHDARRAGMRAMQEYPEAAAALEVLDAGGDWEAASGAARTIGSPSFGFPWREEAGGLQSACNGEGVGPALRVVGSALTLSGGALGEVIAALERIGVPDAPQVARRFVDARKSAWGARLDALCLPYVEENAPRRELARQLEHMRAFVANARTEIAIERQIRALRAQAASAPLLDLGQHIDAQSVCILEKARAWAHPTFSWSEAGYGAWEAQCRIIVRHFNTEVELRRGLLRHWRDELLAIMAGVSRRMQEHLARCRAAGLTANKALKALVAEGFGDPDRARARPRPADDTARGGVYGVAPLGCGLRLETVANYHFRHGSVGPHYWFAKQGDRMAIDPPTPGLGVNWRTVIPAAEAADGIAPV